MSASTTSACKSSSSCEFRRLCECVRAETSRSKLGKSAPGFAACSAALRRASQSSSTSSTSSVPTTRRLWSTRRRARPTTRASQSWALVDAELSSEFLGDLPENEPRYAVRVCSSVAARSQPSRRFTTSRLASSLLLSIRSCPAVREGRRRRQAQQDRFPHLDAGHQQGPKLESLDIL